MIYIAGTVVTQDVFEYALVVEILAGEIGGVDEQDNIVGEFDKS